MAKDFKWEKITKEQVDAIMNMEDPNEFVKISDTLSLRYHSEYNEVEYTDNSRTSYDYYEDTEGSIWKHEIYAYQCGYEDYEVDGFNFIEDIFTMYNNPLTGLGEIWVLMEESTGAFSPLSRLFLSKEDAEMYSKRTQEVYPEDAITIPIKFTNSLNKN